MNDLYALRRKRHLEKMMKYLKYVFNDHFMIVLFFIIGGAGLYYSMMLKQCQPPLQWPLWLCVILTPIVLHIGKIATLVEEADKVFLLPKESAMYHYLEQSRKSSIWLPALVILMVIGVLMPVLVLTHRFTFASFFILVILMWGLKWGEMTTQIQHVYLAQGKRDIIRIGYYIVATVVMAIAMFLSPIIALVLMVVMVIVMQVYIKKQVDTGILNWDELVEKEEKRLLVIYRFINLFTDVPEVKVSIHRRAYLDGIYRFIKPTQRDTFLYLYMRHFVRSNEYSGLFIRLTLIGGILLLLNTSFYISLVMALVFVYLLLFQLVPLYRQFDPNVMTRLYPVSTEMKQRNIKTMLQGLGVIMSVIFFIAMIYPLGIVGSLCIFIVNLLETYLFTHILLKRQLKKYE